MIWGDPGRKPWVAETAEGLSLEGLIERMVGEVRALTGDEPQADDMTCVIKTATLDDRYRATGYVTGRATQQPAS